MNFTAYKIETLLYYTANNGILQINQTRCTILFSIFISLLYMFRATMCPSSGEITVSMLHWYLSFCTGGFWPAGWSCTILLSIFVFLLYMFRATMYPSSGELLYLCDTGICHYMGGFWPVVWSCTILLSIFMSSLRVSGNHVPIIRRNYCFYATLVSVTLYGWLLVCWLEVHNSA